MSLTDSKFIRKILETLGIQTSSSGHVNYKSIPPIEDSGADWIKRGNIYKRVAVITDLPVSVGPPWLSKLEHKLPGGVLLDVKIDPVRGRFKESDLVNQLSVLMSQWNREKLWNLPEEPITDSMIQSQNESVQYFSNHDYMKVSICFELYCPNRDGLDIITQYLFSIAEEEGFGLETFSARQLASSDSLDSIVFQDVEHHVVVTADTCAAITLPAEWNPLMSYIDD